VVLLPDAREDKSMSLEQALWLGHLSNLASGNSTTIRTQLPAKFLARMGVVRMSLWVRWAVWHTRWGG